MQPKLVENCHQLVENQIINKPKIFRLRRRKKEKTKIAVKIALVNEIQVYCLPQSTSKVGLLPRIITVVLDLIDYRR